MKYAVATHILRLADVYLILAEAQCLLDGKTTTNAAALAAFNAVHNRSVKGDADKTSLTFDDVWKERRLELAMEGDRWYDFVRRSYYDAQSCINELKAQKRNAWSFSDTYKAYYESGRATWDVKSQYDTTTAAPNVTENSFTLPYPTEDVTQNPNLGSNVDPVHVDVRSTYSY